MKTTSLEQMENVNGGWSWGSFCRQAGNMAGIFCTALVPVTSPAIIALGAANLACWERGLW